jgi:SPP1 family phage portal protein
LIDDYDLMACFLSNNLQDFSEAIYVVKGFRGDDLSKLRQNIKAKKTVGVGADGGVDIQTVEIPVEARKTKLEIDKDAIYKFGMAFDSTQVGDGNITNVVIKSRYALLDMKCNKAEVRLRAMLKWINEMIVEDINRRYSTAYKATDIEITITRETMVNENDIYLNEKVQAETKAVIIQSILAAAPRLDDESVLKLICEQYELDFEEVQKLLEEQDYTTGLQDDTDPPEVGADDATDGQVA